MDRQTFSRTSVRFAVPLLAVALAAAATRSRRPKSRTRISPTSSSLVPRPRARRGCAAPDAQFLITLNNVVQNAEIASDNYYNNYTTNNQVFDTPTLTYIDPEVTSIQSSIARLRVHGDVRARQRVPARSARDGERQARSCYYFRGVANLFAGETYVGLPAVPNGAVVGWQELLQSAIADFTQASTLSTDAAAKNSYTLARARAYYRLGNKAQGGRGSDRAAGGESDVHPQRGVRCGEWARSTRCRACSRAPSTTSSRCRVSTSSTQVSESWRDGAEPARLPQGGGSAPDPRRGVAVGEQHSAARRIG